MRTCRVGSAQKDLYRSAQEKHYLGVGRRERGGGVAKRVSGPKLRLACGKHML